MLGGYTQTWTNLIIKATTSIYQPCQKVFKLDCFSLVLKATNWLSFFSNHLLSTNKSYECKIRNVSFMAKTPMEVFDTARHLQYTYSHSLVCFAPYHRDPPKFPFYAMFGNGDFIWKFIIGSNLLFGKSIVFKFGFGSKSTIVFKIVKVENLRMTTQTLSFSFLHLWFHNWNP